MAEPNSPLHLSKLQVLRPPLSTQRLSQTISSNFLYKAIFFSVIIALLSLFPSQAPEFMNRSILARTWELLHLLFVGITITYGLFSRRNLDFDAAGKETSLKAENSQSYLSHMLHVSPDDDDESYSLQGTLNATKTQTWNSRCHRNDPVVVIANESTSRPLFLPVRSLKSHLQESPEEMDVHSTSIDGTDDEIMEALDSRNVQSETVVVPSPVSWRSISGRMEMKDEAGCSTGVVYPLSSSSSSSTSSLPPPVLDDHPNLLKTSSFRSYKTPSPKRSTLSPELRAKSSEDMRNTTTFYKFSPPPAPPPPPPFTGHGYPHKKIVRKSFKDELKELSRRVRKGGQSNTDVVFNLFESATKLNGSSAGRSFRTVRPNDVQGGMVDVATKIDPEQFLGYEAHRSQSLPRIQTEKGNEHMDKVGVPPPVESDKVNDDDVVESSVKEAVLHSAAQAGANANEVDKKADEFIAKFRKQITLQRFESGQQAAKC